MEIKIKKIGYKLGTVGWLAAGIADGSIKIHEGKSKNGGKHGLWIKYGEDKSIILAIFNPYNLSSREYGDAYQYEVAPRNGDIWCIGDEIGCTDACWATIAEIAQAWIDHITAEREKDKKVNITIKFEEAI